MGAQFIVFQRFGEPATDVKGASPDRLNVDNLCAYRAPVRLHVEQ
jgi:hypothetical protein